jgi:hypothetical protein
MKKFLLSIATAVLGIASMSAADVVFDFAANTYGLTRYSNDDKNPAYIDNATALTANGGVTVTLNKAADKNGWRLWTDGLRVYKNSSAAMSLSAGSHKITGIKFEMAKASVITGCSVDGAAVVAVTETAFSVTCDKSDVNLAFTVTNNGAIAKMTVTLDGEGGGTVDPDPDPEPDPDPIETVGKGTKESPYTVADLIKLNNTVATGWVKGYIVGAMNTTGDYTLEVAAPFTVAANVFIADNAAETETAKMAPVQLTSGSAVRKGVNLLDNPGNLGKVLAVNGSLQEYFKQPGVKSPTDYALDGQGGGDTPQPGAPTEGPGSEDQPLTVTEAIAKNNDQSVNWVNGIIVGVYDYVEGTGNVFDGEAPFTTNSNLVIATSADATDYFSVQLVNGTKVREDLNLVDRPALIGREVSVCGKLVKYCGVNGMKETSDYNIFGGGLPELPVEETESLTTFFEEQNETTNFKIKGDVTVYYQSPDKKYTFITDGTTSMEVYTGAGLANAYVNGDVLSGIVGKFGTYQNMPQLVPVVDSFGAATKGTPVEPAVKALADVKIAEYVQLDNVDIAEVTDEKGKTSYTISDGTTTKTLFDRFNITVAPATGVKVIGIGAIFGDTQQIFPIQIGESSISEISADVKGEAAIYDLQGRKVAKAGKGLYIVNGKKVLF